jgi:hypothetical protein
MFGFMEIMLMMVLFSGGASNDLVSLIDAPAYFQARDVKVTPEKMAELAVKEPSDGKAQLAQLLALRWLGEEAGQVKKAKDFPTILRQVEEIADGKRAQDPQGFAAEYARAAALSLGSAREEKVSHKLPENSARQDALTWFPVSATIVAAFDLRTGGPPAPEASKAIRQLFSQLLMLPQMREQVYTVAEKLGNVRLDRFSLAFAPGPPEGGKGRIYLRFTGKGDPQRLVGLFKDLIPGAEVKEQKGFRGQRVTVLSNPKDPPAFAVVGDSDLIVAGPEGHPGNSLEMLEEVLAVRAGREKNALAGPLADSLKKVSARANGVVVGELPEGVRREFTRGPEGLRVFPKKVIAELVHHKGGNLQARLVEGTFDSADEAKTFTEDVARLKAKGLETLKGLQQKPPPGLPVDAKGLGQLAKVLESLQAEAREATAHGSVTFSAEAVKTLILSAGVARMFGGGAAPPPPPPPPPGAKKSVPKQQTRLLTPAEPAWAAAALTLPAAPLPCLHEHSAGA